MDPLAAIGLAGNIVQFLDLGGKLVSGAVELYNASDGATSSNRVLDKTSADLHRVCRGLEQRAEKFHGHLRTESEAALLPLAESCSALGEELTRVLEDLKVKGRHKRWKSARKALEIVWKAKDIRQYEKQLNLYRSQITTRLLTTLTAAQLEEIIVANLQGIAKTCSNLAPLLTDLESESFTLQKQIRVIESLRFPQIFERADNIKKAHPATFEWLFEGKGKTMTHGQQSNIFDWLRTGTGTFWVSGKAGSGKSTLMKFFYNNRKTTATLKCWASGNRLLVASFFFWHAGTKLQNSQQGLLQTLLFHIFRQDPTLIAVLCPHRWQRSAASEEPWTWTDLLDALANLKNHRIDALNVCIFIDGLDEYGGEHMDVIKIIESLICSPFIKICFSSRPWNVFERFYGDNLGQKLRLEDLTRSDIARFTRDRLAAGTEISLQPSIRVAYNSVVQDIVDRAQGVFLWVFLVVRSLRRGMINLDTPSELQARLLELPTELEEFFQQILDTSEKVYHSQAARLYLIQLTGMERQITAIDVAYFAESDIDFALRDELISQHASNLESIANSTETRVLARCQDLLEFDVHKRLHFLHRTVRDFLETSDIYQQLQKRAGEFFDPHYFMCNSMVLQLRMIAEYRDSINYSIHPPFEELINSFWYHVRLSNPTSSCHYSLSPPLDRALWNIAYFFAYNAPSAPFLISEEVVTAHYEGLVADQAADMGILGYLSSKIGGTVDVIQKDGHVIQKLPLEVALQYMRSEERHEVVRRLLDRGANPNEKCTSDASVWRNFIRHLRQQGVPALSIQNIDLLVMLLHVGAIPSTDEVEFLNEQLQANYWPGDAAKLKSLRLCLERSALEHQETRINEEIEQPSTKNPLSFYFRHGPQILAREKSARKC